jgi:electron transfer flavoprotein beta subunit
MTLHIVCCVKQVPDTAEVKIDPETNTLMRSGVESISNPFDVVAVEAAVRLKEAHGGLVSVLSMGPPQAETSLREALALGADRAILLSDRTFAGADTLATSYTLARAVQKLTVETPVDLILCGKQAIDGDTAQTGPGIATRLGYTLFTYVTEITAVDTETRSITVRRNVEGGDEIIRGQLPALLTVELGLATPRRAPLPQVVRALRAGITTWDGAAITAEQDKIGLKGSPTWVRRIFSPPVREGGPRFDTSDGVEAAVGQSLDTLMADATFTQELRTRWGS